MIPKTIHYCWFGRGEKPKLAKECIKSWIKYCPDYSIIEWNEDNFDISSCPLYVRQAYEKKKWAFVSDYVRLKVVYENGGTYLDVDVELIKPLDSLLANSAYFGREDVFHINTGLGFGAEKDHFIVKALMEDYEDTPFILSDGKIDDTTCPVRNTKVFAKFGTKEGNSPQVLDGGVVIYPFDWFCPINYSTGKKNFTDNTVSIHHFSASWQTAEQKAKYLKKIKRQTYKERFIKMPNRVLKKTLGEDRYKKLKQKVKRSDN